MQQELMWCHSVCTIVCIIGNRERRNNNIENKYLNADNLYCSSSTRVYKKKYTML